MDNEVETLDSSNEQPETIDSPNDEVVEVAEEETKREYSDYEKQLYARNKELEKKLKEAESKAKEVPKSPELSPVDLIAITRANVEPEDLDEVIEYSKFKNISIAEALKSGVVKATLSEKAELRKSAAAINTGSARRTSTAVSDDQLISNARKGIMPDSEEDIARLAMLRRK